MRWDAADEMTHIEESLAIGEFEMNDTPYLGQRCRVTGVGFGTIVDIREDGWLRVEIDAGAAHWYATDTVELLATYPAC